MHSRIRASFWLVGIALAAYQAWIYRMWINGDAVSYFDMSDAVATGHWSRLVNGAWSPLYPFLLGVANAIVHPSPSWEFPLAHAVNFVCFLFAFGCFEVLLRQVLVAVERTPDHLPRWVVLTVGYALFLWGSLAFLGLMKPTPDMLMFGLLYLALALVLRLRNAPGTTKTYVALGIVLALGYLAKTIMLPLGLIMLGIVLALQPSRAGVARTLLAAGIFAALSAPYIAAESQLAHRFTIGQSAAVVHLSYLDRVGSYWTRLGTATGAYLHAPRQIFAAPATYEFARPIDVTYPLWYDPSYWVAGVHPTLRLDTTAGAVAGGLTVYAHVIAESIGVVIFVLVLLTVAGWSRNARSVLRLWPLWLVPLAALGAYALVHVEERYVGPLFLLLWLAVVAPLPFGRRDERRDERMLRALVAIVVVTLAASTVFQMRRDAREQLFKTHFGDDDAAIALTHLGVAPGDRVARVSKYVASGWARLARITVVAEVARNQVRTFWKAPATQQDSVLRAFGAVGARAVIADAPAGALPSGWQRLGTSQYVVYVEPRTSSLASGR